MRRGGRDVHEFTNDPTSKLWMLILLARLCQGEYEESFAFVSVSLAYVTGMHYGIVSYNHCCADKVDCAYEIWLLFQA